MCIKKDIVRLVLLFPLLIVTANSIAETSTENSYKPLGDEAYQVVLSLFEYDKSHQLNARTVDKRESLHSIREKISFTTSNRKRVSGYLALPKSGEGPFPCILLLHGLADSKEKWLKLPEWGHESAVYDNDISNKLINAGFAVFAIDAEFHGERSVNNDYETPKVFFGAERAYQGREMLIQTIIDYRLSIDYLESRSEIDANRIGALGYSMGGGMTFGLAAIDSRIKTVVSCVGISNQTMNPLPSASPLSPITYTPHIKSTQLLMLMAKNDPFYSVETARKVFESIPSKTKNIIFYDSKHDLPKPFQDESVDWFNKHLK